MQHWFPAILAFTAAADRDRGRRADRAALARGESDPRPAERAQLAPRADTARRRAGLDADAGRRIGRDRALCRPRLLARSALGRRRRPARDGFVDRRPPHARRPDPARPRRPRRSFSACSPSASRRLPRISAYRLGCSRRRSVWAGCGSSISTISWTASTASPASKPRHRHRFGGARGRDARAMSTARAWPASPSPAARSGSSCGTGIRRGFFSAMSAACRSASCSARC